MNLMNVLSGRGFVMYNKELAHKVSVNGAIIFGQLCSSYESFGSKGMLTLRDGKEYFFLTIETLEEETALSYKQQMKAVKDLEEAGYIETRNMGVPQKRHFHITDKIVKELLSSSDKREELDTPLSPAQSCQKVTPNLDQRERLDLLKGDDNTCQKVSNIKKKNKKEINKNKILNINNDLEEEGELLDLPVNKNKIKFQGEFSAEEIKSARRFIAPQMYDTVSELDWSDEFRDRFICYMHMARLKYVSPTEVRKKNIEIEKSGKHIVDRALYMVKGILLTRQDSKSDTTAYAQEKMRKIRKEKEEAEKARIQEAIRNGGLKKYERSVPFYNWLEN